MVDITLIDFIRESNRIEGIERGPSERECTTSFIFLRLKSVTVADVCHIVSVYEPGAVLRDRRDMGVRVGKHVAPAGGPWMGQKLDAILILAASDELPYVVHQDYEHLHPFTDGNGRSGRMLWLWMHWRETGRIPPLGFLHTIYYEMLEHSDGRQGQGLE